MSRIIVAALLLITALSAPAAAVCLRVDGRSNCSDVLCTTAEITQKADSAACCAPVVQEQSSIVAVRAADYESAAGSPGNDQGVGAPDAVSERRSHRYTAAAVQTAAIAQTGQTIYLRTGRLRL
jgi:hypothetical protein